MCHTCALDESPICSFSARGWLRGTVSSKQDSPRVGTTPASVRKPPPRVVTVVLEVEDVEKATEFWVAHTKGMSVLGCKVAAIANGNAVKQVCDLMDEMERKEV